jgi:hypothetical protein
MDCPDDPMGCPDPDVDYGGEVIAWGSATSIGADDDQVFWSGVDPSFREGGVHGEIRRLHAIRCRTLSPTTLTPTPGQCPIRQDRALATVASGHQRGPGSADAGSTAPRPPGQGREGRSVRRRLRLGSPTAAPTNTCRPARRSARSCWSDGEAPHVAVSPGRHAFVNAMTVELSQSERRQHFGGRRQGRDT